MLTAPPSLPESGVLLFTSDNLFYWKIGSASWSCHNPKIKPAGKLTVVTVQGKVYAMDAEYNLFVIEISPKFCPRPLAAEVIGGRNLYLSLRHFLVECGGELLHLLVAPIEFNKWFRFEVFQFNSSGNRASWVKKESLGNWAIFVGYDNRVPDQAVENPERWGGKRNSVDFADVPWTITELDSDEIYTNERDTPLYHGKFKHQCCLHGFIPTSGSRNARVF